MADARRRPRETERGGRDGTPDGTEARESLLGWRRTSVDTHVVTLEFARATQVRLSVPEDRPTHALAALVELFVGRPNVVSGRLGLMEVLPEDGPGYFTYAIGVECEGGARKVEHDVRAVLRDLPPERFPITLVPPTARYLTRDAIVFFERKPRPRSWIRRLLRR